MPFRRFQIHQLPTFRFALVGLLAATALSSAVQRRRRRSRSASGAFRSDLRPLAGEPAIASQRDALAALRGERQRTLAAVRVDRRRFEAEAEALQTESAQITQLIAAAPPTPPSPSASPAPGQPPSGRGGAFVWPVGGVVTSPLGWRWGRMHEGIDIGAPGVTVGVGQGVAQGELIASVGCTGHCFGDHVHYEGRVGGFPTDPMGYL